MAEHERRGRRRDADQPANSMSYWDQVARDQAERAAQTAERTAEKAKQPTGE